MPVPGIGVPIEEGVSATPVTEAPAAGTNDAAPLLKLAVKGEVEAPTALGLKDG